MKDKKPIPCFMDFEASSLDIPASYPIEVAWLNSTGSIEAYLINPEPIATWHNWEPASQEIHGISREYLIENGKPPAWVARRMNESLSGQTVYWDGGIYDSHWCAMLFTAAEMVPTFYSGDVQQLWYDALPVEYWKRDKSGSTAFDKLQEQARLTIRVITLFSRKNFISSPQY
jgi:hypothetical protein